MPSCPSFLSKWSIKNRLLLLLFAVLQMMGRAGRPQYDDHGVACVLVHDIKKDFYKKFLYEPFPVESSLLDVLPEHLNAEIVAGTICSKQDAIDYLTWTFFFRRLLQNPAYYGLEQLEPTDVNHYLTSLIHRSLSVLEAASCLEIEDEGGRVAPTSLGRIASYYYLSYHTLQLFRDRLGHETKLEDLLSILSDAHEYNELPVRHNEDLLNAELAKKCLLPVNPYTYDSSHTKAHLLFQSHFSRLSLPCADYVTDTKSVLDQAIRILQAMMDVAAEGGWLATTLRIQQLLQMVIQAMWIEDPAILMLPHFDSFILPVLRSSQEPLTFLPVLQKAFVVDYAKMCNLLATDFSPDQIQEVRQVLSNLPVIDIAMSVRFGTTSVPLSIIPNCGLQETVWIDVPADQECLLDVTFTRQSLFEVTPVATGGARPKKSASLQSLGGGAGGQGNNPSGRSNRTVYAPKFPKPKDEGWFLTLGSIEKQELLAMKRVTLPRVKCSQQLSFTTPARLGRMMLTLYFMSDSYLGLDQQYNVHLNVCKAKPKGFDDDYETNNDF